MNPNYPPHFSEPIRLEIAVSQIQHDLRKLLPSISYKEWDLIDLDIAQWPSGEKFEIEPIFSFWNFFNGFSRGLKLKSLISWVTAQNVHWEKRFIDIRDTYITWNFPGFEFMGKWPIPVHKTMQELKKPEHKERKKFLTEDSIARSRKYAPRDQFPIVALWDDRGIFGIEKGYYIFEGNRRVVKHLLESKMKVLAYVGRLTNEKDMWPKDYWIPTGLARDMVFLANKYQAERDHKAFEVVAKFYQLLLRDFNIFEVATVKEAFRGLERNEELLREIMTEDF